MKYFAGIDPGETGAMAILDEGEERAEFIDYPDNPNSLDDLLSPYSHSISLAILEHVHSMPKQGVSSSFKFGKNFGIWQGVLAAFKVPVQLITSQRWRKILDSGVPAKPTKEDLRQYALRRWPGFAEHLKLKKHHGRAEALIMASYARMIVLGNEIGGKGILSGAQNLQIDDLPAARFISFEPVRGGRVIPLTRPEADQAAVAVGKS